MSEWKMCRIGDLCDTISETYKRTDNMVVLINTSDVLEGEVLNHTPVPNENLKGQFKKTFQRNDILYSEIRPANKRFAFIDFEDTSRYIASTKLMVLRPRKDVVLPLFLYAILKSRDVIEELQHLAETRSGTFPQITFSSELAPMEIMLPDFTTQKQIVGILSAIEDKIRLNTAINENLEQQAQAIFKAWFVDFEPFGGAMPNDWRMGTLSEICGYSKDKVDIDDLTLDTYYSTENMQPNRQGAVQATTLPTIKQTTACKKGDVLISNIRPYFKKILYCFSDCGCSTDVLCFVPNKTDYSAFLYCALYADKFFDYMVAGSKGTKMPRGDKQQIMVYPICIPSAEYIDKFNQAVAPMLETVYTNRIEANNLANLRDTLLPKLMNGEIDVSEVKI